LVVAHIVAAGALGLPDPAAARGYLRGRQVPLEATEAALTPLQVAKRGVLIIATHRSGGRK
jgi:hypothetical protein